MFCPALTDGSIGDMIYFHSFKNPGLVLDIVQDIRALNERARMSKKAGMIILGGGVCKHQIANAMLIVSDTLYLHLPSICGTLMQMFFPSAMVQITLSISYVAILLLHQCISPINIPPVRTPAKNSTDPTRALVQTKPSPGAKFEPVRSPSKYAPSPFFLPSFPHIIV